MGILDSVMGAMGGKDSNLSILKSLGESIQQQGGIEGIKKKFEEGGLTDILKSWISTGQNLPISPDQIQAALGADTIAKISEKTGLDANELKQKLSDILPTLVDKLTPNGQVPTKAPGFQEMIAIGTSLFGKK